MRIRIISICCFALICCGLLLIVRKANQPARLDQTKIVFEAPPLATNESVPLAEMPLEKLVEVTVTNDPTEVALNEIGFSKTNSIKISVK